MSEELKESQDEEKGYSIQFRITGQQHKTMLRLADMLYKNKSIGSNSVNALVKACAFTQVNLYLQMEARESAYQEKQLELDKKQLELEKRGFTSKYQGYDYVPNLGTY